MGYRLLRLELHDLAHVLLRLAEISGLVEQVRVPQLHVRGRELRRQLGRLRHRRPRRRVPAHRRLHAGQSQPGPRAAGLEIDEPLRGLTLALHVILETLLRDLDQQPLGFAGGGRVLARPFQVGAKLVQRVGRVRDVQVGVGKGRVRFDGLLERGVGFDEAAHVHRSLPAHEVLLGRLR